MRTPKSDRPTTTLVKYVRRRKEYSVLFVVTCLLGGLREMMKKCEQVLSFLVLITLRISSFALGQDIPAPVAACDSPVYCHGDLLDTIQRRGLYDSKGFVDMALRYDPDDVVRNFLQLPDNPTDQQLRQFVDDNFSPTSDLMAWSPPDWTEHPEFVDSIQDDQLRQWALDLNAIWRELGRQLSPDVSVNPKRHSLLTVPNPFIVAGGRFSEFYYWDSYWIIRGLLLCEMYDTARGMIENMAALIDSFGMVPNGGRIYYSRRSQPPLLTQMVAIYYNATGNDSFVEQMLPFLDQEYDFWQENRSVYLESFGYEANHYATFTNQPRPESYLADIYTSMALANESARYQLFTNLASGAESGWDFSSRWLATRGPLARQLASIRTTSIVPVDLNAILCSNEGVLLWLHNITGNASLAEYYAEQLKLREETFDEIFWDESSGTWRDFDTTTSRHSENFYLSSVAPLVWQCGPSNTSKQLSTLSYLKNAGFLDFPGGIPASNISSGQQWDFPNAWPPLQWMLIYGLSQGSHDTLKMAAKEIAQKWISANWMGWKRNRTMFEKYDSEEPGAPGSGGEYVVQGGFGWTNGVVLDLLYLYSSSLSVPPPINATNSTATNMTSTNTTDTTTTAGSGSSNNRNGHTAWVVPVAVVVPLIFLSVVCIIWGRWVYKRGKKRYWQRVQNEHLMAYGATEDSGQPYGIGELYENKYFVSDQQEINKNNNNHTIKGNEDERHKSLSRQDSANGKNWYEQTENHLTVVPTAATPSNASLQGDSGILSTRTSDNISDSTVMDKIDEENTATAMRERSNGEDVERIDVKDTELECNKNDDKEPEDDRGFDITITLTSKVSTHNTTQESKILTTDV